jgi:hypothetical protein
MYGWSDAGAKSKAAAIETLARAEQQNDQKMEGKRFDRLFVGITAVKPQQVVEGRFATPPPTLMPTPAVPTPIPQKLVQEKATQSAFAAFMAPPNHGESPSQILSRGRNKRKEGKFTYADGTVHVPPTTSPTHFRVQEANNLLKRMKKVELRRHFAHSPLVPPTRKTTSSPTASPTFSKKGSILSDDMQPREAKSAAVEELTRTAKTQKWKKVEALATQVAREMGGHDADQESLMKARNQAKKKNLEQWRQSKSLPTWRRSQWSHPQLLRRGDGAGDGVGAGSVADAGFVDITGRRPALKNPVLVKWNALVNQALVGSLANQRTERGVDQALQKSQMDLRDSSTVAQYAHELVAGARAAGP